MREPKQRVIFSNYYSLKQEEGAKDNCIERHLEDYPNDKQWEPSEEEILEEMEIYNQKDWEYFVDEMTDFIGINSFILQGTIGRWDKRCSGGYVFNSFDELSQAWSDCGYVQVYDEDGHLYIECSHHDGTDSYEIRMLNEKGEEYYNNHYGDEDRIIHDHLMKAPYSVLPNYAHKVYGCKKREYEQEEE